MKLAKTFLINLSGTDVQIEAMISFASFAITDVISLDGHPVQFGEAEMEQFEQHVEARIKRTSTQAFDLSTFKPTTFTVHDLDGVILAIEHESGHIVERNSPTFSEVAESWAIDREYAEAVESDQPHLAAAAGFLRPVPVPTQQGIGNTYRRAA